MARQRAEISPLIFAHSSTPHSQVHTPSSSVPSTPIVPERPPSPEKKALLDSNAFLTAVAAQERRVFELKEELQRAEANLEKLKKQWAMHETTKKRNELRHLEQLQPLRALLADTAVSEDDDGSKDIREQERRKLRLLTTRQPKRTVFSGSRHTKTLSLLSPRNTADDLARYSRNDAQDANLKARRGTTGGPRSNTASDLRTASSAASVTDLNRKTKQSSSDPPKDLLLKTSKQIVGDFREGFWTFFEDLRQATVGEEIDTSSGNFAKKSTINPKPEAPFGDTKSKLDEAAGDRFPVGGFPLRGKPKAVEANVSQEDVAIWSSKAKHQRRINIQTIPSDPDGWDTWDSPPRYPSVPHSGTNDYTSQPMASPLTDRSTPRTSLR